MKIKIEPAPAALSKYTHSAPDSTAKELAESIAKLEAAGYTVLSATGERHSVPNTYRSAYKMLAPYYSYCGTSREIKMVSAKLENRPRGAAIPAHIIIQGNATPVGYRALSKNNNLVDLIPAWKIRKQKT